MYCICFGKAPDTQDPPSLPLSPAIPLSSSVNISHYQLSLNWNGVGNVCLKPTTRGTRHLIYRERTLVVCPLTASQLAHTISRYFIELHESMNKTDEYKKLFMWLYRGHCIRSQRKVCIDCWLFTWNMFWKVVYHYLDCDSKSLLLAATQC